MTLPLIAGSVIVLLGLAYTFYGRFIARQYQLDASSVTPAQRINDGVDFVPTRPFYLLGQHFSAIAAAGPIAGPVLACQQFGWLPALLWISFGVVFIGAVHDLSTLIASVRHDARSIAEVIASNLGPRAGTSMLLFIWIALVYVIVAFADVTASTFVVGDPQLAGLEMPFNQGGAVAAASILYLGVAVVMGFVERFLKPPLWMQTLIFVPATLGAVALGPVLAESFVMPAALGLRPAQLWAIAILGYCAIASVVPVWTLLQPRGYLGGFVLYIALAVGTIGIFFGGFSVQSPAFNGFSLPDSKTGLLFPFLFVTIACGACSGFHGLVCSGTTSKQIANEQHCKSVGYGAMLLEGFVAVIALATVMIAAPAELKGKGAGTIYGVGLGRFLTVLIGEGNLAFAITFGAMAFSTFVFDTLDVSTRLGRYILQELLGLRGRAGIAIATAITVGTPLVFVLTAGAGAWQSFWTLFGTSNQLLAALSLLGVSVWLKVSGKRYWYTFWPMLFVTAVTATSLFLLIVQAFFSGGSATPVERINGGVAVVLLVLAASIAVHGARVLLGPPRAAPMNPSTAA
jgi:carbon starvation protein